MLKLVCPRASHVIMLGAYIWQQRMRGASLLDEHCQWTWPHGERAGHDEWAETEWAKAEWAEEYLEMTWWAGCFERAERAERERAERPERPECPEEARECAGDWIVL